LTAIARKIICFFSIFKGLNWKIGEKGLIFPDSIRIAGFCSVTQGVQMLTEGLPHSSARLVHSSNSFGKLIKDFGITAVEDWVEGQPNSGAVVSKNRYRL
jgi:hypothetical protein